MKQAYEVVGEFKEGLARVKKFGFIDKNGEWVIGCNFGDASDFCSGFAKVKVNGKWFKIDSSGKDPNASESSDFDVVGFKNNVEISKDSVKVAIDCNNKVEIPIKFDDIKSTTVVKNMVKINGK